MNFSRRAVALGTIGAAFYIPFFAVTLADEVGHAPRSDKGVVRLSIVADSGRQLQKIDPSCAARFVGNASESSHLIALDLPVQRLGGCVLSAEAATAMQQGNELVSVIDNVSIRVKVTSVKGHPFSAVRVSQNFGGSQSITRYFAAAVVKDKTRRKFIYSLKLLPASVKTDDQAHEEFAKLPI